MSPSQTIHVRWLSGSATACRAQSVNTPSVHSLHTHYMNDGKDDTVALEDGVEDVRKLNALT
jgi:hypothetical protein